ncbi:MAG: DUF1189 family protein [Candidatus Moranbacteria bacterium]|nr:DUF1189 family protein [Candidatus Moranbacteria bacterium]
MNNLWQKIQHRVYRPEFFGAHVFEAKKGLRFYSLLLLFFIALKVFLALPGTVHFYQTILSDAWGKQEAIVTALFPDELVLSVKDGKVATNVSEPYVIAVPPEWRTPDDTAPVNLLVINTQKSIERSDSATADTLMILGESSFGFHDPKKGEFRIYDLDGKDWKEDIRLDKEEFALFIARASAIVRWLLIVGCIALPFIVYGVLWVSYLLYLVFGALIVLAGAKWRGHQISYGDAYVAGMYLFPIPFLYEFLSSYGRGLAGNIPFAFSVILFVMTLINFQKTAPEKEKADPDATVSA